MWNEEALEQDDAVDLREPGAMKKLKVGDRVACYNNGLRYDGTVLSEPDEHDEDFSFKPTDENRGPPFLVHPKQCRRLKPRKLREWEVYLYSSPVRGDTLSTHRVTLLHGEPPPAFEVIRVREVKP